jgi:hypothetical protein
MRSTHLNMRQPLMVRLAQLFGALGLPFFSAEFPLDAWPSMVRHGDIVVTPSLRESPALKGVSMSRLEGRLRCH